MVHLKDFSVLSPTIQSSDLLKAIETAKDNKLFVEAVLYRYRAGVARAIGDDHRTDLTRARSFRLPRKDNNNED